MYIANGKPVILLLFNAGPLDVTWAKFNPKVSAIMECFFPAQTTGEAIYKTLTASGGISSVPAGRLPATWPSYLQQVGPNSILFHFGSYLMELQREGVDLV